MVGSVADWEGGDVGDVADAGNQGNLFPQGGIEDIPHTVPLGLDREYNGA